MGSPVFEARRQAPVVRDLRGVRREPVNALGIRRLAFTVEDIDAAVAGPVAAADFYYPADARSAASDAARSNLAAKGFALHPL